MIYLLFQKITDLINKKTNTVISYFNKERSYYKNQIENLNENIKLLSNLCETLEKKVDSFSVINDNNQNIINNLNEKIQILIDSKETLNKKLDSINNNQNNNNIEIIGNSLNNYNNKIYQKIDSLNNNLENELKKNNDKIVGFLEKQEVIKNEKMKNYFENIENNKSNLENYFQEILSEIQNMNERNLNVKINDDISNKLIEKMESIKEEIINYHNI